MGSKLSKSRNRDSSPLSRARRQLSFQDAPLRPQAPKPPKEPAPIRILEWPIRESKPTEDPWLPGWFGPRLPEWLLWVPVEVTRPPEHTEVRPTTRTAYIRCLEARAMRWHEWRYPHKREFDLRYGIDRAEEAEMVATLNNTAYAQRELLGRDWEKLEVIPTEPTHEQGPPVDGTVPDRSPFLRQRKMPPYWMFYPAGPTAYSNYPDVDPEEIWIGILRKRAEKWTRWHYPDRHEFRKRFERYEPDGYGGRRIDPDPSAQTKLKIFSAAWGRSGPGKSGTAGAEAEEHVSFYV
ncbi:hypothetical protein CC79DRAFT_1317756 [Sarocladium strictum]